MVWCVNDGLIEPTSGAVHRSFYLRRRRRRRRKALAPYNKQSNNVTIVFIMEVCFGLCKQTIYYQLTFGPTQCSPTLIKQHMLAHLSLS